MIPHTATTIIAIIMNEIIVFSHTKCILFPPFIKYDMNLYSIPE